jgi:hypothetical protein
MFDRHRDFAVVGKPGMSGRVVGEKPVKQEPQPRSQDVLSDIKAAMLSVEPTEISAGIRNLPFTYIKKLAYLRSIETFLSAQLTSVRKEIQSIQEDSLLDTDN